MKSQTSSVASRTLVSTYDLLKESGFSVLRVRSLLTLMSEAVCFFAVGTCLSESKVLYSTVLLF